MVNKATYAVCVCILIILAVCVAPTALKYHRHRQVEWWLEHSYPISRDLIGQAHLYFASYEEWSRAGREIPGIGPILMRMYGDANSEYDKKQLLYAMGAVATAQTVSALLRSVRATDSPVLREWALIYGLTANISEPRIQEALLEIVKDAQQPIEDRCWVLAALIHAGSTAARDYARQYGRELLAEAMAGKVRERYTVALAKQLDTLGPGSQSMPGR